MNHDNNRDNVHRTTQAKRRFRDLLDYAGITVGVFMGSIGWLVFLLPNNIAMGGISGISSILFWGLGVPVQVSFFIINALLLSVALKILGFRFCIKTIYAVVMLTLFTSIISPMAMNTHMLSDQPFMAAILGACFIGTSIGICLLCNGSTGGSDVIAAIINKYRDISLGHVILFCDLLIVTSSYIVLRDWEQVLYGYVVLFVTSFCVDSVVNKARRSVQFFIISEKYEELARLINTEVDRGCTLIDGQGVYAGRETKLIFLLARQSESQKVFRLIDEIDPHAFVAQSAVIGVYGLGFDRYKVRNRKNTKPAASKTI